MSIPANFRFDSKVVVITGSSSGIGQSAAILFGERGAALTIHGTNEERLQETLTLLKAKGIPEEKLHWCLGKIEDEEMQRRLVDETVEKFGRLDVLVNNAGLFKFPNESVSSLSTFDKLLNINLRAPYNLTQLAFPHLQKTRGNIVNNSSALSLISNGVAFPYEISKAGVNQMTRSFALDYAQHGVRVNAVLPYVTATNLFGNHGLTANDVDVAFKHFAEQFIPMGRLGKPMEVAEVIVFLASEAASYVTGANVVIDGGALSGWKWAEGAE